MSPKPQFGRKTIVAAGRTIDAWTQGDVDALVLDHALEHAEIVGAVQTRATRLIYYLLENGETVTDDGENLVDTVVRDLVERAARRRVPRWDEDKTFAERYPELARALDRDGFVVKDGRLVRAMPATLGLPAADDEVHELLRRFGFATTAYHLDQALLTHGEGKWGAANGQIRPFIEGLINEIAEKLAPPGTTLPPPGGARLNWLAKLDPPFVLPNLREWDGQGKGFLEAFIGRLQPNGPHPGIPEEEDCTFRLHATLIVTRLLLRRLAARLGA